ncbi:MAG: hypothetical protein ACLR6W_00455 [Evtepia sp.]
MADFYDYLDDLDLDFDPDDPTDPLNALLEQIREDMEDTSPKAYVLNEDNLKKFMIVYKNIDLVVDKHEGKYFDIKTDPKECDFAITVEFPFLSLSEKDFLNLKKAIVAADAIDVDPSDSGSILIDLQVKSVYERVLLK